MQANKKLLSYLKIIAVLAFLVSVLGVTTVNEIKIELKAHHILNMTGLTLGIIIIGLLLMRRHLKDGGIILLFGNLLLVAEILFSRVPSAGLIIISGSIMALSGLGLILLAGEGKNNP